MGQRGTWGVLQGQMESGMLDGRTRKAGSIHEQRRTSGTWWTGKMRVSTVPRQACLWHWELTLQGNKIYKIFKNVAFRSRGVLAPLCSALRASSGTASQYPVLHTPPACRGASHQIAADPVGVPEFTQPGISFSIPCAFIALAWKGSSF